LNTLCDNSVIRNHLIKRNQNLHTFKVIALGASLVQFNYYVCLVVIPSGVLFCPGAGADPVVHIENLPCSRNQTFCEANVLLGRPLELGRVYDMKLRLRDTRGDTTTVRCTIRPTNSSTPVDTIFPHLPMLVLVPEVRRVRGSNTTAAN
jgi:hypothetical protein